MTLLGYLLLQAASASASARANTEIVSVHVLSIDFRIIVDLYRIALSIFMIFSQYLCGFCVGIF